MAFDPALSPAGAAALVAAIPLALLGASVALLPPRRAPALYFAAFALLWAAQIAAANLARLTLDAGAQRVLLLASVSLSVPAALYLAYFASLHPTPAGPARSWRGALALGALGLPAAALLVGAPGQLVFVARDPGGVPYATYGLAYVPAVNLLFAGAFAYAGAQQFLRARGPGPDAPRARLVGLALLPHVGYTSATQVAFFAGPSSFVASQRPDLALAVVLVHGASLALLGLLLALAVARPRGPRDVAVLAALVAPAAVALAERALAGQGLGVETLWLWRLWAVGMVSYAILRHRLFDLDLRLKRTLRRGTVASAFLGAFLVASQGAELVLPGRNGALVGALGAGVLVLAMARVQRLAGRVADAAMPRVQDTPEYLTARKVEVYRAALAQALQGGAELAPRDVAGLAALRSELGLTERDHALLEHVVRAGSAAPRLRAGPGEVLAGTYRVVRVLGEGGNGVTYLARDRERGQDVAVKALRPELDAGGVPREVLALQSLRHPRVVAIHAVEPGPPFLLVMEYLAGGSLADRLRQGPLDPAGFRRVALGLLEALQAVHDAGMVHRDVKPSNVLLTPEGEPKLADFGVAHQSGFDTTVGGAAVGTVRFMSPEHARGKRVTPRSDLFSAAATLYEAYTGGPYLEPAPNESAVELQMRAAAGQRFPAGALGPPAPPALRSWFARALDPRPEQRFPTASAARAALEAALPRGAP